MRAGIRDRTLLTTRRAAAGTARGVRALAAIAVVVALVSISAVVVLRWAPEQLAPDESSTVRRADELAKTRTALLAMLGGLVALGGAIYTARTFALSRIGQITDRFTRAVDQLGAASIDVRLGGIYALERLARESPADHPAIMAIVSAFVRQRSPSVGPEPLPPYTVVAGIVAPPADVQAAVTVIGRRHTAHDTSSDRTQIDLSGADLRGARLAGGSFAGVQMAGARLEGADLSDADLTNVVADGARLDGADLTGARMDGARLIKARLHGAELRFARLRHANLRDSIITNANLFGADLGHADLWRADLQSASLWNAQLNDANLTDARLGGVKRNNQTVWPEKFAPPPVL
jgi:hypothetical protein